MAERFTKAEYLKLKSELDTVKKSKDVLEERQKELNSVYIGLLKELKDLEKKHNKNLKELKAIVDKISDKYILNELYPDIYLQGEVVAHIEKGLFMNKGYVKLKDVEWPILKGGGISHPLKEELMEKVKAVVESGGELDEYVKKAEVVFDEIKRITHKVAYLENDLIPKMKKKLKKMERLFDERRHDEMLKLKRFMERGKKK